MRDKEVEFVKFGKLLPQMLDARSTSEVAKRSISGKSHAPQPYSGQIQGTTPNG
jgi:hypothetical protein